MFLPVDFFASPTPLLLSFINVRGWSPRSWTISWAEQSLIFFIERNVMEGRKWMKESVWSYVCGWVGGWYRIIMVRKV